MNKTKLTVFILAIILSISCISLISKAEGNNKESSKVIYAGTRSSSYGIKPFPSEKSWETALKTMSTYYEGSTPAAVWIVGELSREKGCRLFFPSDGKSYPNIIFEEKDKHEAYLNHFDTTGIKVFLQVESGNADMLTLIDLVLNRYKHHPCVAGFGVDVEWYKESEQPGWGVKVTDDEAEAWEKKVKSYNSAYRLFLKHWERDWMPPAYRGDLLFISDSQEHKGLDSMLNEFTTYWADYFKPNTVGFQVGYDSDKDIWGEFKNPPADLGKMIIDSVDQDCCVFWVDFTLRDVKLVED